MFGLPAWRKFRDVFHQMWSLPYFFHQIQSRRNHFWTFIWDLRGRKHLSNHHGLSFQVLYLFWNLLIAFTIKSRLTSISPLCFICVYTQLLFLRYQLHASFAEIVRSKVLGKMEPQRSSNRMTYWRKSVHIPPLPSWWTASDRSFTTREISLNWKGWFWEILTVQIHLGRWNIEEVLMELATPSTTHTPPAPILKKMAALSSSVRSWVTTSTSMTPSFSTPPQTPQHFLAFPSVSMEGGRWWRSFTLRLFQFNHSIVIDSSKVKKYVKLKPCQDDFYSCFEVGQHNRMFSFFVFWYFFRITSTERLVANCLTHLHHMCHQPVGKMYL